METALAGFVYRSAPYRRFVLDGPVPSWVRRVFPWHAPGDRTQAEAILDLQFLFYGRRIPFGTLPWSVLPAQPRLARALHGFTWLADLKAAGSEQARERARALVLGWIGAHRRWDVVSWSPAVLGLRLASWLAAWDFIFPEAEGDERARFLEAAGRQARHLARVSPTAAGTADAFPASCGEIAAALCLDAVPLAPALDRLERHIAQQILPDGGHLTRDPAIQLSAFQHFIDVRAALLEAEHTIPQTLTAAIERMAPMVRMMRHGDGRLALFQGAKESDRTLIDSLLAASRVGVPALASAPQTGYERLAAGRSLVLVDTGAPAPDGHAAPLAFELSCGRERIVVNCGTFGGDDARWQAALRSTPAHSTLTVADASAREHSWLGPRPIRVTATRQNAEGAAWLEGSHDGYRRRFGLTHRRRLYLGDAGSDLRGEDVLEGRSGRAFHLRFHLHPDVQVSPSEDGTAVDLRTATGGLWQFLAVGGGLSVEDSTYLGSSDQPRGCRQIVVSGTTAKGTTRLKWAFRQQG